MGKFWCLEGVSDGALQEELKALLTMGARTEARIVAHLAEVDARKLHLAMGSSSLFDYCLNRLGLSNNEAFHRITAARLARRFPIIFELLERRDVHLTAVCLLRDCLTLENHYDLLREVSHKTRLQIEELLARKFPKADVRNRLARQRALEPLSEGRYRLQLSVSGDLKQKLELARDLMSHTNPSGDLAVVVERALDCLIERLQSRRFAQAKAPRPRREADGSGAERSTQLSAPTQPVTATHGVSSVQLAVSSQAVTAAQAEGPMQHATGKHRETSEVATLTNRRGEARQHVRHEVRRAVVARDGQRCTFVGEDGRRCDARAFLQFHHQRAWALGGPDSAENLSLMRQAHNQLLAERELGTERVAQAIEQARSRR